MKKRADLAGIVEGGYDDIAQTYHEQRDEFKSHELLSGFSSLLPPSGDVGQASPSRGSWSMRGSG
jgi:hypothetical protein